MIFQESMKDMLLVVSRMLKGVSLNHGLSEILEADQNPSAIFCSSIAQQIHITRGGRRAWSPWGGNPPRTFDPGLLCMEGSWLQGHQV